MTLHLPKPCRIRVSGTGAAELRLLGRRLGGQGAAAVVAPPHPLYGGSMDNPVVLGIVEGLRRAGCASLAFNWRGVEGSEGVATDELTAAVADYQAAFDELRDGASGPFIAAGYSFGAGSALLAAKDDARIEQLVLVAPPLGMLRDDDLRACARPVLIVVGDDDEFSPLRELRELVAPHAHVTLEVLRGVDHFFHFGGLPELPKVIADHVTRHVDASAAS